MENLNNDYWYQNLDYSMIWVCAAFSVIVIIGLSINYDKSVQQAKTTGVKLYLKPTWKNYLFHFLCGLAMLPVFSELGMTVVLYVVETLSGYSLEVSGQGKHVLAALSGLTGGFLVAKGIKLIQKLK